MNDIPIPRDGRVKGWKHPAGVQISGSQETPDACPSCGAIVAPVSGARLGQASMGETVNPEPWQEIAECPECHAGLRRIPGDPWIATTV